MDLFIRFIVGMVVGFLYILFFTQILAPIELRIKGKRLHHNSIGTLTGVFIIIPLVFFFCILNFDLLNYSILVKLGVSLLGLSVGTVIEHEIIPRLKS